MLYQQLAELRFCVGFCSFSILCVILTVIDELRFCIGFYCFSVLCVRPISTVMMAKLGFLFLLKDDGERNRSYTGCTGRFAMGILRPGR